MESLWKVRWALIIIVGLVGIVLLFTGPTFLGVLLLVAAIVRAITVTVLARRGGGPAA
jgi:hypothetical protein